MTDTATLVVFGVMSLMALFITGYFLFVLIGGIINLFRVIP